MIRALEGLIRRPMWIVSKGVSRQLIESMACAKPGAVIRTDSFVRHLDNASEIVSGWPIWKQRLL